MSREEDGSLFNIVFEPPIALKGVFHRSWYGESEQSITRRQNVFFDNSSREVSSCVEIDTEFS